MNTNTHEFFSGEAAILPLVSEMFVFEVRSRGCLCGNSGICQGFVSEIDFASPTLFYFQEKKEKQNVLGNNNAGKAFYFAIR